MFTDPLDPRDPRTHLKVQPMFDINNNNTVGPIVNKFKVNNIFNVT